MFREIAANVGPMQIHAVRLAVQKRIGDVPFVSIAFSRRRILDVDAAGSGKNHLSKPRAVRFPKYPSVVLIGSQVPVIMTHYTCKKSILRFRLLTFT